MTAFARGYALWTGWQFHRLAQWLPLILIVQTAMAIGVVVGFSMLMPEVDSVTATYLTTGAPTVLLLIVGVVVAPQQVAEAKTEGSHEFSRTLPIPRLAFLGASLTVWLGIALPGLILGLVVAALRFDISFAISPVVVPVALLVALTAIAIGFAIGTALPPMLATMVSQILIFVVLLFSPINTPVDRLPDWLATVHEALPFEAMADLMRATLMGGEFTIRATAFALVGLWCAASLAVAHRVSTQRN